MLMPACVPGLRAVARCDALGVAPYSDMADGLFRGWLSPAHRASVAAVAAWMGEAGLHTRVDPAGNLLGRYDGPLGVMLGIECVAALHAQGRRLPCAIEVIAFGDEEGSHFPASMLSSRAVAGTLHPAALQVADGDGVTLADALAAWGLDIALLPSAAHAPHSVLAYDVRAGDAAVRDAAAAAIAQCLHAIAVTRGVQLELHCVQDLPASPCDPHLVATLDAAIAAQGLAPRQLVSGAGRDAMVMAALCPTAMLFLRCAGCVSHHPAEHVDPADADVAVAAMLHFIESLGDTLVR
ncbi:M20/M25/M40 family metallo-hydrolase [Xanthomonas translucens pv. undulosa]|nr:M20/M25/M40 family metallo-hydrolase [Xanthomonas translucens]QEN95585.1 M20/M25/M40 family metallo-hydrolase [Xanthomonas translucens pv. undulosa]